MFIIDEAKREVLLIRKKRGLGAGKINGPGGKIDPGEKFDWRWLADLPEADVERLCKGK